MGMFDSIMLEVKCPHCGNTSEMECQTKTLDNELNVFKIGDNVGTKKYDYLFCIADCHSKECLEHSCSESGYRSGFGRMIDLKIQLDYGVVTGLYNIIQ